MGFIINVYQISVNSISKNGSFNIGPVTHNSHTANSKTIGTSFSFGDYSTFSSNAKNLYVDQNQLDQGEIEGT